MRGNDGGYRYAWVSAGGCRIHDEGVQVSEGMQGSGEVPMSAHLNIASVGIMH